MFAYWDRLGTQGGAKVCAARDVPSPWMAGGCCAGSDAKERSRYFPLPLGTKSFFGRRSEGTNTCLVGRDVVMKRQG